MPCVCLADSIAPFGTASAYNLVALGTVDALGNTLLAGNIIGGPDVTGRIAAAGTITNSNLSVGSTLNSDPWGALAIYGVVATGGLGNPTQINMGGGGSAYAPGSNGTIYFNDGNSFSRVTSGPSGIDFTALRKTLDAQSLQLDGLTANGVVVGTNAAIVSNKSWLVLQGTDSILNVFNITEAEFNDSQHAIDIIAPAGSTIVINVDGTDPTLGAAIFYNGTQHSGDDASDDRILFNFADAQKLTINPGLSASVLAPFAVLSGTGQLDGNIIAAQIGITGEIHNEEFIGTLPGDPGTPSAVPEPNTLALMGTGILSMAAAIRRRMK
jgi:choice-of-anchor A domain-containing protein